MFKDYNFRIFIILKYDPKNKWFFD